MVDAFLVGALTDTTSRGFNSRTGFSTALISLATYVYKSITTYHTRNMLLLVYFRSVWSHICKSGPSSRNLQHIHQILTGDGELESGRKKQKGISRRKTIPSRVSVGPKIAMVQIRPSYAVPFGPSSNSGGPLWRHHCRKPAGRAGSTGLAVVRRRPASLCYGLWLIVILCFPSVSTQ
jgi:hypothetical protein